MLASAFTNTFSDDAFTSSGVDFLSKYILKLPTAITLLADGNSATPLDSSYEPGAYDIVCGRGKGRYNRPGNKYFRTLVATYIPLYQSARSKIDKGMVLNAIIDKVRSQVNPDTGLPAEFVKYSKLTGWVRIGDEQAREKAGHAIREAIAAREGAPAKQVEKTVAMSKAVDLLAQQKKIFENMGQRHSNLSNKMQVEMDSFLIL